MICVNELHPLKADDPMDFTEEGIATCVNELHPLKANDSMDFTEEGIVICANDEQFPIYNSFQL